jgi:lysozyme family protein
MDNSFTQAIKFTAKWEGGWADDKTDPGGKTSYGISDAGDGTIDGLIDLDRDGDGDVAVEELTREEALDIYFKFYWLASGCNDIAAIDLGFAVAVFDTAVNCGVSRAKRWLKQAKNVKQFLELRRLHYYAIIENNPSLAKFKKGWLNRLNDLHKYLDILSKE